MHNPKQRNEINDPFSRDVLEFAGIIELIAGFLSGPLSAPRLKLVEPRTAADEIRRDLECAAEAREHLRSSPRPRLSAIKDPRAILEKIRIEGVVLTAL